MFPRYDMDVPEETKKPQAPLVPMSAEDFARRKRRVILIWVGAAIGALLIGAGVYRASTTPLEAQAAMEAGERSLKANRYPAAIASLDQAISLKKNLTRAYLLRARAQSALGNQDAALQDFTKYLQLEPSKPEAYLERAGVDFARGDFPAVIADCGEALNRDPKSNT